MKTKTILIYRKDEKSSILLRIVNVINSFTPDMSYIKNLEPSADFFSVN